MQDVKSPSHSRGFVFVFGFVLCRFVTGYPIRIVMSAACIFASIKISEMSALIGLVWFDLILLLLSYCQSQKVGAGQEGS
jgi:hypothetical protein